MLEENSTHFGGSLGVVMGFVGARLLFVLTNFSSFLRDPVFYLFSRSGFVFLGGLLVAIPTVWFVLRRWKVRFWPMADLLIAPLALAHGFGRVGCFFAGCCYGKVTDSAVGSVPKPVSIFWAHRDSPCRFLQTGTSEGRTPSA